MGKSTSWISAVRRVLKTTPTDNPHQQKTKNKPTLWIFRKFTRQRCHPNSTTYQQQTDSKHYESGAVNSVQQQKSSSYQTTQHYAAIIIQTAFRAYLARRALQALKGIVKLQALVRGSNIRKQVRVSLERMKALFQVQSKMLGQCSRPPPAETRKSMYAETNNLWNKYKDIHQRKPTVREGNNFTDQWGVMPCTIEDIEALFQRKTTAGIYHENDTTYATSHKIWRFDSKCDERPEREDTEWLSQWLECRQSKDNDAGRSEPSIKTVDVESLPAHLRTPTNLRTSQNQETQNRRHSLHVASPVNGRCYNSSYESPMVMTPSLSNSRPLQVRSASPRCLKGYRSQSTTSTPSLRSDCPSTVRNYRNRTGSATTTPDTPNYMAATESAKARARTQSTPRQRSMTVERERGGSAKKRLSYPIEEKEVQGSMYGDLKSPSFRSDQGVMYNLERGTVCSCTECDGGELSPASTTQIRRWLA